MNRNNILLLCLALLVAPLLEAQTNTNSAKTTPAPAANTVPVPVRRIQRPSPINPAGAASAHRPAPPGFNAPPPAAQHPAVAAPPPMIHGPEPARAAEDVPYIYYNFPAVPLDQLLDIYSELVGRTLLRATSGPEAVQGNTTITLKTQSKLTKSEAIVALETILGMNGITIVPIGDKFAKVVTEAIAPQVGGYISTNTNNIPEAGKMITQIVQIKYADPKELVEALKPFSHAPQSIIVVESTDTLILRDYAENVSRMLEMVNRIDVLTPNSIKPEIIPIRYALAADIASALSALGASGGTAVGKSTSGAGFQHSSGTSGVVNGVGGNTGTGGYPGQPSTTTTGGTSALGSSATSARSSFQQNLQKIVSNAAGGGQGQFQLFGQTKIIADERTNSLLVFANDDDMKMIKLIIKKLDVVLAQVLIDAIVMEINLQYTRNTGVSYGSTAGGPNQFGGVGGLNNLSSAATGFLNGTSVTNGSSAVGGLGSTLANLPGGFSYFGHYGNDLDLVLEAVAGDSRINVLSRPRIQTSHAVQADLFIGNTVPYVTGTYNYGYGTGPSSQYTQLEVGIHLQVLPLINPDGLVVMDIQADVEQLGPDVQIAGVGGVPTTTKRQAGAKVAVRNGETIILGGFISDSRSTSVSGIPYLMNIPGLGNLFRSTAIENLRTELIMLMRPTVLPSPEVAAVVATQERDKLSGVKEAEWEIRNEERKNNIALERKIAAEQAKEAADERKAEERAARKQKAGEIDTTTNTVPLNTIPSVEDQ